ILPLSVVFLNSMSAGLVSNVFPPLPAALVGRTNQRLLCRGDHNEQAPRCLNVIVARWEIVLACRSIQSRFCSTVPSAWPTFCSFFYAVWKPTIQVCTFLRDGGSVRESVPRVA